MIFSLPFTILLTTGIDGEDLGTLPALTTTGIHSITHTGIALHMVIGGLVRIITGIDRISTGIIGILIYRTKTTVIPIEPE